VLIPLRRDSALADWMGGKEEFGGINLILKIADAKEGPP
jgi:hypothetical protein